MIPLDSFQSTQRIGAWAFFIWFVLFSYFLVHFYHQAPTYIVQIISKGKITYHHFKRHELEAFMIDRPRRGLKVFKEALEVSKFPLDLSPAA